MIMIVHFWHSTEILDFGYPQNTDTGILKTFITQTGVKSQVCILPVATSNKNLHVFIIIIIYFMYIFLLCNLDRYVSTESDLLLLLLLLLLFILQVNDKKKVHVFVNTM